MVTTVLGVNTMYFAMVGQQWVAVLDKHTYPTVMHM